MSVHTCATVYECVWSFRHEWRWTSALMRSGAETYVYIYLLFFLLVVSFVSIRKLHGKHLYYLASPCSTRPTYVHYTDIAHVLYKKHEQIKFKKKRKRWATWLGWLTPDQLESNTSRSVLWLPDWCWAVWWAASGRQAVAESAAAPAAAAEADRTPRWRWSGGPHLSHSLLRSKQQDVRMGDCDRTSTWN